MVDINKANGFVASFEKQDEKWPVWARLAFLGAFTVLAWTGIYFVVKAIF